MQSNGNERASSPVSALDDAGTRPSREEWAFAYYARLGRVKRHLDANISRPLSCGEAARIAGVSETYFSRFFHERVGLRFKDWSEGVRIEAAKRVIEHTNIAITEVAWEVGFRALRTFERAFKRRSQMSPREFKRRVRPRCWLEGGK